MSIDGSIKHTLAMQAGCKNLQDAFDARAVYLDTVMHDLNLESDAVRQLHLYDARTLTAAQDVLEMPVHGPADLFIKYDTVALYEEFYLERPSLIKSVLHHIRDDAQTMVSAATASDPRPSDTASS